MRARDLPNLITLVRFLLVPPVVVLLLNQRYGLALGVFMIAGFSDALDGYLAKRFQWTSRLGGLLDPLADKALLISCYLSLAVLGMIPLWLVVLVIVRDLVIISGAAAYHLWVEVLQPQPRLLSKLNTAAQLLLVLAVMFSAGLIRLDPFWIQALVALVLITTVASGADYVWTWGRRARHHRRQAARG
ncbi:MAG TPA: CDP-alcohol phosphatidyltransferase family protein [Gammaproteobacteria bacterium]|nr:CDP-alcohol phosphatidyltransferase family protein [Gammaproteobacteria bacterium]